jgi:hypothetical protein
VIQASGAYLDFRQRERERGSFKARVDDLFKEGIALSSDLAPAIPRDATEIPLFAEPAHIDRAVEFMGLVEGLIRDERPWLLPVYQETGPSTTSEAGEGPRRSREWLHKRAQAARLRGGDTRRSPTRGRANAYGPGGGPAREVIDHRPRRLYRRAPNQTGRRCANSPPPAQEGKAPMQHQRISLVVNGGT